MFASSEANFILMTRPPLKAAAESAHPITIAWGSSEACADSKSLSEGVQL